MKPTLLSLFVLILFGSCGKYQYFTVSGTNISKNEKNELVAENDSLRVVYHFAPAGGQVSIRVFNKTTEPLEIEWRKSAIIVNEQTVGYYDPKSTFSGELQAGTWRSGWGVSQTSGTVNGQIQSGEPVQFIPPQSFVESRPVAIPTNYLQIFQEEKAKRDTHMYAGVIPVVYKRLPLTDDSSTARFRSYLTFKLGRAGEQKEFSLEHRFYISEIWKSAATPENFADIMDSRGDRFYVFR